MAITSPELLTEYHLLTGFQSGETTLDEWLVRRALKNQTIGASRTYVVTDGQRVVGYYALAAGSVLAPAAPGTVRRNMPDPIPVMVLGRLAVDRQWQGQGLGKALLRDSIFRTLQAAEIAGIRAILVHALHEQAAVFYRNAGFVASPIHDHTLMLLLKDAKAALLGA